METFSALLALWEGNPSQWQINRSYNVFFGVSLNKRLSKSSRCRLFGRHCARCDVTVMICCGVHTKNQDKKKRFFNDSIHWSLAKIEHGKWKGIISLPCWRHRERNKKWPTFCRRHFQIHFLHYVCMLIENASQFVLENPTISQHCLRWRLGAE